MTKIILFLLLTLSLPPAAYAQKIRIASVGNSVTEGAGLMNIECTALPHYPIQGGVSAPFVGVSNDRLIVAGGCNFVADVKTYYKEVYALDISKDANNSTQWKKHDDLSYELAYGSYITTPRGIVCIGGMNQDSTLSRVAMLSYDTQKGRVVSTELPSLPLGVYNTSASLLNNIIYLTGGNTKELFSLNIDNLKEGWTNEKISLTEERQQPILLSTSGELLLIGGYDEANAGVSTDILRLNVENKQWEKLTNLPLDLENRPVAMIGASGLVDDRGGDILFAGGVNHDRFYSALQRIKRTKQAEIERDSQLFSELRDMGLEYLSQDVEWYKFRTSLLKYDVRTNTWTSLGDYQQLARAGAGMVLHNNRLYIVCGELKPAVRTNDVSCVAFLNKEP